MLLSESRMKVGWALHIPFKPHEIFVKDSHGKFMDIKKKRFKCFTVHVHVYIVLSFLTL